MNFRSLFQLRSIGAKLTLSVTATALVAAGVVGGASYIQQDALSDQAIESALIQRYEAVVAAMTEQGQRAEAASRAIANDPRVAAAFASGDRPALLAAMKELGEPFRTSLGLGLISFQKADGTAMARVHSPDAFGDNVLSRRNTIRTAVSSGSVVTGLEPGRDNVSIFAVTPVRVGGQIIGVADVGAALGVPFLNDLKRRFKVDIAMHLIQDGKLNSLGATFAEKTLLDIGVHQAPCSAPAIRSNRRSQAGRLPFSPAPCAIIPASPSARWRSPSTPRPSWLPATPPC